MFFPIISLWQIMTPRGVANLHPRVTIGRNYKGAYLKLLHTKYKSSGPHGFREEDFFTFFFAYYKSMEANDPGAWPT